jgi:hypothetical protein
MPMTAKAVSIWSLNREELLENPANPEVFFNNGCGQAFAIRCLGEDLCALGCGHLSDAVQVAFSAIAFATS